MDKKYRFLSADVVYSKLEQESDSKTQAKVINFSQKNVVK